MIGILRSARVLICMGTGGVGKTTVAAGLGACLARAGKKVLVLTVDPSMRLKQTLGLNESGEPQKVLLPELPVGGTGELWGTVMNPKKTFDDFVIKAAAASGESAKARRILDNRLYQQLSTTLAGSQEFTALENLLAAERSGRFDVIILDTPPAQHAIEFLGAPQKLASIFNDGIAKWFRNPEGQSGFLSGLFQAGTRQALKILENVTGAEFMGQLSDFFSQIHSWQGQLETRAAESQRLLVRQDTHFLLVTAFDEAKFREGEGFAREIQKAGYRLSAMVINRAHPLWFRDAEQASPPPAEFTQDYRAFKAYYELRRQKIMILKQKLGTGFKVLELLEQNEDIANPAEVSAFAIEIEKALQTAPATGPVARRRSTENT